MRWTVSFADALWRWAEKHATPAAQHGLLLNLMRQLYNDRESAAALAFTERFAKADNTRADYLHLFRALCHLRLTQPDQAAAELIALLKETPASPHAPQAKYLLALAHLNADRKEDARLLLEDLATNQAQTEYGPKAKRILDGLNAGAPAAPPPAP